MEYLKLGTIIGTFGIDGTLKIYSTTSKGNKRYKKGNVVLIHDLENNQYEECVVLTYRHQGLFDFVKVENINSIEEATSKKGMEICVIKNRDDLDDEEYFYSDLKGCKICDENMQELGYVSEVEEFPAQLTLRVSRKGNKDFFVPFIEQFIISVDVDKKVIIIKVIEGLLWR